LAGISYDSVEVLAGFAKRYNITFPLLADVGSATIKKYGIYNTAAEEALARGMDDPALKADVFLHATTGEVNDRLRGIPYPGTFMIDRQGRVTSRFFEDFFRERGTVTNTLLRLGVGGETVQGTQVTSDQLELTTYPSDEAVAVGNRFSLVFDVTPKPGMHVYAPGAVGYRVIALTMSPQAYVRPLPMQYPASEIYFFAPLKERVPVFQKPFRLLQEVVIEATPDAQAAWKGKDALTVSGTLEYQACDDKICYNPVTVPLSWSLKLRPGVPGAQQGGGGRGAQPAAAPAAPGRGQQQ
jgi:hypothetical protein